MCVLHVTTNCFIYFFNGLQWRWSPLFLCLDLDYFLFTHELLLSVLHTLLLVVQRENKNLGHPWKALVYWDMSPRIWDKFWSYLSLIPLKCCLCHTNTLGGSTGVTPLPTYGHLPITVMKYFLLLDVFLGISPIKQHKKVFIFFCFTIMANPL